MIIYNRESGFKLRLGAAQKWRPVLSTFSIISLYNYYTFYYSEVRVSELKTYVIIKNCHFNDTYNAVDIFAALIMWLLSTPFVKNTPQKIFVQDLYSIPIPDPD